MTRLTLFTAPKPFTDPHINIIQRNTLENWLALGDQVEVVVIGDDPGIAEACAELNVQHIPDVRCNDQGTPLISSIFDLARGVNDSPYLAYANADILFLPELVPTVEKLGDLKDQFLAVGQRWDLDITQPVDFSGKWWEELRKRIQENGTLHGQTGSDYFIYPRGCFVEIPDFAVGRAGWDNWMIYWTRRQHWALVDTTDAITVIHQNHDYRHLPGGARHYRLPETSDNIKLAGGRRTIFRLTDAVYNFDGQNLNHKNWTWERFWREVEIFPLVTLRSRTLGWVFFAIFHPVKAYKEARQWLVNRAKKYSLSKDQEE
jgi:hypothetical protein